MTEKLREHSRFSPSKADQFLRCPGSIALTESLPPRAETRYARQGTVAHEILNIALKYQTETIWSAYRFTDYNVQTELGVEDNNAIEEAYEYITGLITELSIIYKCEVDVFLDVFVNPPIASAPGEASGWLDVALYVRNAKLLIVIDYKHGVGVPKAAKHNFQISQYAAGLMFGKEALIDVKDVESVALVIVQPRSFHKDGPIRTYLTTVDEIKDYIEFLDERISAALKPNASLVPGEDQCFFCAARAACPAREAMALKAIHPDINTIEQVTEKSLPVPSSIDVIHLGYVLQATPMLQRWINDVNAYADELMMYENVPIPGQKLVESRPRRFLYGEDQTIAPKLAAIIGVPLEDVYETKKLKSVTELERLIVTQWKKRAGKGKKKQVATDAKKAFAFFTIKKSSGSIVRAPDTDERPAITRALASFGNIAHLLSKPKGDENDDNSYEK